MSYPHTLMNLLRCVSAVAAIAWLPVAHAQLYAREAPPGSAFIHVFNGTAVGGVNAQIGDKAQPPLLPYSASAYVFLPPGECIVQVGSRKQSFQLEGNHYYTVSATADGLQLFEFHTALTGLKAMIGLLNLMPGTTLAL